MCQAPAQNSVHRRSLALGQAPGTWRVTGLSGAVAIHLIAFTNNKALVVQRPNSRNPNPYLQVGLSRTQGSRGASRQQQALAVVCSCCPDNMKAAWSDPAVLTDMHYIHHSACFMCLQTDPEGTAYDIAALLDLPTMTFERFHITESPFCSGTQAFASKLST